MPQIARLKKKTFTTDSELPAESVVV